MNTFFWILVFLATFTTMEFMAWFTHKYVMHGFLWNLHRDHHHKDHKSWFERNDAFFIFYAVVSMTCFYFWSYEGPMVLRTLLFMIFSSINDLSFFVTPIIGMQKGCDVPTKFITNTLAKAMANVLECYLSRSNTLNANA
jgi:hypothetical protein